MPIDPHQCKVWKTILTGSLQWVLTGGRWQCAMSKVQSLQNNTHWVRLSNVHGTQSKVQSLQNNTHWVSPMDLGQVAAAALFKLRRPVTNFDQYLCHHYSDIYSDRCLQAQTTLWKVYRPIL